MHSVKTIHIIYFCFNTPFNTRSIFVGLTNESDNKHLWQKFWIGKSIEN